MGKSKQETSLDEKETPRVVIGDDSPVYPGHRLHLPCQMKDRNPFNVLQILKDCIGKDVTRIAMPITINEPLTLIQRFAENLEYVDLLYKAVDRTDSLERLQLISAFVVSGLSGILDRISKPFNPILGETFEMTHPDGRSRFVAEQVSHHPPISVFHLEDIKGRFKLTGSCQPKLKFTGRAVNIQVKNLITLEVPEYDETYNWGAVDCIVDNLFIGRPRIEYDGTFTVTNGRTKEFAKFTVHPSTIFRSKKPNEVEGHVYDSEGSKKVYIFGFCNSHLSSMPYASKKKKSDKQMSPNISKQNQVSKEVKIVLEKGVGDVQDKSDSPDDEFEDLEGAEIEKLWDVYPRPSWCQDEYCFTSFAIILNEITESISAQKEKGHLPRTDSRLRPDLRMLENGKWDEGGEEKLRLEAKQRQAEKSRSKNKENWKPLWFEYVEERKRWEFKPVYWERKYEDCPDIF